MPQLEITAMTFGPYGIGHVDNRVVMVPNAAPGDVLEVDEHSARRGHGVGKIREIVRPGPHRRTAPCPFLPQCGGCDWQQIDYPEQLRLKGELVAREFRKAFRLELEPQALVDSAPSEFGYRSRIRLKVDQRGRLGFHELDSNRLAEIDRCLVAAVDLGSARKLTDALRGEVVEIEVVGKSETSEVLVGYLRRPCSRQHIERAQKVIAETPRLAGVVLRGSDQRNIIGDVEIDLEVEPGCTIRNAADVFSQVNVAQNQKLVATVIRVVSPAPDTTLVDLFCGSGNFSFPAARRGARVIGVDSDPESIMAASRNAERLGLSDTQFVAMKADALAAFLHRARLRPAAAILDPPRTGAAALMVPIAKMRPLQVVYVSCDLATLVRDLKLLTAESYRIEQVRAFDFFPNTHHIEIVARAVLT